MADNLKYNEPGSGPLVATDDVGSVHYQIMKLDIGKPDGSSVPIVGQIPVVVNSGTVIVTATNFDIRDLSDVQDSVRAVVSGTIHGINAADTPVSSYPVVIGAVAEVAADQQPTNLVDSEGDVVRIAAGRDGAVYVKPHPPRIWHYSQEFTAAISNYNIRSGIANLSHYIGTIYYVASGSVFGWIRDGNTDAAALKWKYYAGGVGDGVALQFNPPIKMTANTHIGFSTMGTCFLNVSGYTAP